MSDETLISVLLDHNDREPDRRAFTFLGDGETESAWLTYESLASQAQGIAARLLDLRARGERALLLYPDGLEFIPGFFGCLMAGVIGVPVSPPHPNRLKQTLPRLVAISRDSGAKMILTTRLMLAMKAELTAHAPTLDDLEWIATDLAAGESPVGSFPGERAARRDDVAYLQYTSGSTGTPRGVMVTHGNVLHNERLIQRACHHDRDSLFVSWSPLFHDMGLIASVLQPLTVGFPSVLMSPYAFLQKPLRWLQAISTYQATTSGGPNFAFDLCVRKTSEQQRRELDLSSWRVAFNSAEPVQSATIRRFVEAFEASGLSPGAMFPCYGLAEATLLVTDGRIGRSARELALDRKALERSRVESPRTPEDGVVLVGSGRDYPDLHTIVVDPETGYACPSNLIGELWVGGPSVAAGFWNRPDETEETFRAFVRGSGDGPYLRTGDLGFRHEGEVFVTGRLKDAIIIRGRNLYASDIERAVQATHASLRPGCGAAFSVGGDPGERLVVVQELDSQDVDSESVIERIRQAIVAEFDASCDSVVLVSPRTIPKTSSGKLQRYRCRDSFLRGELDVVASWQSPAAEAAEATLSVTHPAKTRDEIRSWLVERLAALMRVSSDSVSTDQPFDSLGLDSLPLVELVGDLEDFLDRSLEPTLAWDYPTIGAISEYLGVEERAETPVEASPAFANRDRVAIVGISCRFPSASSPEEFWNLLSTGKTVTCEAPPGRYRSAGGSAGALPESHAQARFGGFLADIEQFDPGFFGISAREAERIDPQQRLLLEVVTEAIDDAGIWSDLRGSKTGVFVGISAFDYVAGQLASFSDFDGYSLTGNAHSIAANRISYHFGLRGPSLAIDTACSSSLVALHLACDSLRRGESDTAIVAGVNILLLPQISVGFAKGGALAPDGLCRAFDAAANGMVRGEGAAALILRMENLAVGEGDRIRAIVRGSAINNDGATNGITAPSASAQREVLRAAYENGGVSPTEVGYIEAHGTGTVLGDGIELRALADVVGKGREPEKRCVVSSVKSNIGHLESAAGVAGIVKAVLALEHRTVPGSQNFRSPGNEVDLEAMGLLVSSAAQKWETAAAARIAGVSSFGFGGTNAHVVLQEAAAVEPAESSDDERAQLVALSAHSDEALKGLAVAISEFVSTSSLPLGEIAFNSGARRRHYKHRTALVAGSRDELASRLGELALRPELHSKCPQEPTKTAFVFSGHGSQWWGMERSLFDSEPVFRNAVEEIDSYFAKITGRSLIEILRSAEAKRLFEEGGEFVQPAIFAMQVALADVWRSWGIVPAAVAGHSVGEIAAACCAGILTRLDALKIILARNELLRATQEFGGAMGVVGTGEAETRELVDEHAGHVFVAGANSPRMTLLAGYRDALLEVVQEAKERGLVAAAIRADGLAHCPLVEGLGSELSLQLSGLSSAAGEIPFHSSVRGGLIDAAEVDARYWGQNLSQPVRFHDAVASLTKSGCGILLEVSPHPVLEGAVRQCVGDEGAVSTLHSLHRKRDPRSELLHGLGFLYAAGHEVEWKKLHDRSWSHATLPSVPWQRKRYWFESDRSSPAPASSPIDGRLHPLVAHELESPAFAGARVWTSFLSLEETDFLSDHRVQGAVLYPGAAFLEMAVAISERMGMAAVADVEISKPLRLEAGKRVQLQTVVTPQFGGSAHFAISSRFEGQQGEVSWLQHCSGEFQMNPARPSGSARVSLESLRARCVESLSAEQMYDSAKWAADYGPTFRGLRDLWRGDGEAIGRVELVDEATSDLGAYRIHPALLDACIHVTGCLLPDVSRAAGSHEIRLPVGAARYRVSRPPGTSAWCHASIQNETDGGLTVDLTLFDTQGEVCGELSGLVLARVGGAPASRQHRDRSASLAERLQAATREERRATVGDRLRQFLGKALHCPASQIDESATFDDLGFDSLMAVEIKLQLEDLLGTDIPVGLFLGIPTVGEFVDALCAHLESPTKWGHPDLEAEVVVDDEIELPVEARIQETRRSRIFLTGVTGYLGPHLLSDLLARTDATVHCLVRAESERDADRRIKQSMQKFGLWKEGYGDRIVPVPGDLRSRNFGLPDGAFDDLANRVGEIFHSAAWLNTVYPYEALKEANVGGTQQVLKLATRGAGKFLHHISTMAVFPIGREHHGAVLKEESADESVGLPAGYCESKWVAERIVERVAGLGLPTAIYRPGFISGQSRTGDCNTDDLLCRLLKGCIELRAAPLVESYQDMTPVDYASRAIVEISRREGRVGFYHIVNPKPLSWAELTRWIQDRGYEVAQLAYTEWVSALRAHCQESPSNPLRPILPSFEKEETELFVPREWSCTRTLDALEGTGIECPSVLELVPRYFDFFEGTRFLDAPGRSGMGA